MREFLVAPVDMEFSIDASTWPNPGPSGIGIVVHHNSDRFPRRQEITEFIGHYDNNVAEYMALLRALQYANACNAKSVRVLTDSEVVSNQMSGIYKCQSSRLRRVNARCRREARNLKLDIKHIMRDKNDEAHLLAQQAVASHFQ